MSRRHPFRLLGDDAGTKRALLVGINYRGQSGQLSGCQNDVLNMKKYLIEKQGYTEHNILVIMDDGIHHFPTRQTMIAGLRKLVEHSSPGDSVYFHYSGHGGLLMPRGNAFKNSTKDVDETLIPLDHERSGHIRDFSLFNHFVKPMASGVTVTCVMDCCHSGAVLNLPYSFQPTSAGTIRSMQNMSSLTNLAFLYILAGGLLPHHGFESIVNNIEETTGGDVSDYQGAGMDDAAEQDGFDYAQDDGYQDTAVQDTIDDGGGGVDYGDNGAGDMGEGQVVDGEVVGQDMYPDDSYAGAGFNSGDDGGFGDAAGFGDTDYGNIAGDDVDCGCFQDVLGALLESDF